MTRRSEKKSPFDVLGDSLHSIDLIFNSKREDLVKRLREGNAAWEQRKKQYPDERPLRDRELAESSPDTGLTNNRKGPAKDSEYASRLTISDLLQSAEDGRRAREASPYPDPCFDEHRK